MNHLNKEEEIRRLLESLFEMSECEDWDESRAQELIMWGGELFSKYYKQ